MFALLVYLVLNFSLPVHPLMPIVVDSALYLPNALHIDRIGHQKLIRICRFKPNTQWQKKNDKQPRNTDRKTAIYIEHNGKNWMFVICLVVCLSPPCRVWIYIRYPALWNSNLVYFENKHDDREKYESTTFKQISCNLVHFHRKCNISIPNKVKTMQILFESIYVIAISIEIGYFKPIFSVPCECTWMA